MSGIFAKIEGTIPNFLAALTKEFGFNASVKYGKRYAKIVRNGESVYAFIDPEGNIYMPASWAAPAKHIRGSIFDANFSIGKACGEYGIAYLR